MLAIIKRFCLKTLEIVSSQAEIARTQNQDTRALRNQPTPARCHARAAGIQKDIDRTIDSRSHRNDNTADCNSI